MERIREGNVTTLIEAKPKDILAEVRKNNADSSCIAGLMYWFNSKKEGTCLSYMQNTATCKTGMLALRSNLGDEYLVIIYKGENHKECADTLVKVYSSILNNLK